MMLMASAAVFAQQGLYSAGSEAITVVPGGDPLDNRTISVFPNPVKNALSVDLGTSLDHAITVSVYDFIGQELIVMIVKPNTRSIKIDTTELETGVYFVKIQNGSQELVRKFVK